MIIFTPILDLPDELLFYKCISQVVKLNLTSYYAGIPVLDRLIPSIEFIPENVISGDCTDPSFDIAFHGYIMQNDEAFKQLMDIMAIEFNSTDVLIQILIEVSDYRNIIAESLAKLVQQRYGHNIYYIMTAEDFAYAEVNQDFSVPGLFMMDQDLARWRMMHPEELRVGDEYEP